MVQFTNNYFISENFQSVLNATSFSKLPRPHVAVRGNNNSDKKKKRERKVVRCFLCVSHMLSNIEPNPVIFLLPH